MQRGVWSDERGVGVWSSFEGCGHLLNVGVVRAVLHCFPLSRVLPCLELAASFPRVCRTLFPR